MFNRSFNVITG